MISCLENIFLFTILVIMKKILVTWHYASIDKNYLSNILDAFENIDEILYLNQPKEIYDKFPNIPNIKYLELQSKLTNIADFCNKYFEKENEYIINISVNDSKNFHIPVFALFFVDEEYKNVKYIKYENSVVTELTIEDVFSYIDSKIPNFSTVITILSLSFVIWALQKCLNNGNDIEKRICAYIKTGYPILLLGERGTGKSQLVENIKEKIKEETKIEEKIVSVNCASFADDTMAEAQLFGYEKGAFTGAYKKTDGYFQNANNGILFLDEIHHLTKKVQAKLMLALQPNQDNKMCICKLGSADKEFVKFRLIVATNKTNDELRGILLPDFYDRIVRHVIELPPLRDGLGKIEQHWKDTWEQLNVKEKWAVPQEKPLIDWLKEQQFWGNYRDLQKIASYYHTYNLFDEKNKPAKNAFEYAKNEFEKYGAKTPEHKTNDFLFEHGKTAKEMEKKYYFELCKWAIERYGSKKNAADALKVDVRTLNNWKNSKANNMVS